MDVDGGSCDCETTFSPWENSKLHSFHPCLRLSYFLSDAMVPLERAFKFVNLCYGSSRNSTLFYFFVRRFSWLSFADYYVSLSESIFVNAIPENLCRNKIMYIYEYYYSVICISVVMILATAEVFQRNFRRGRYL